LEPELSISEKRNSANLLRKKGDTHGAIELYEQIWELEKTAWDGKFLAICKRQEGRLDESREYVDYVKSHFPDFKPILSDELWLDYQNVKDYDIHGYLEIAEKILENSSLADPYLGLIYIKTCLAVARRATKDNWPIIALSYLDKLNYKQISNKSYLFAGQIRASDQKQFFVWYADALIGNEQVESFLNQFYSELEFSEGKQTEFTEKIISSSTFDAHDGERLSRKVFGRYLKQIFDERYHRTHPDHIGDFVKPKLLMSGLSQFLFCPISYSINQTVPQSSEESWEIDEWRHKKLKLGDRLSRYKDSQDFKKCFEDTTISDFDKLESEFLELLKARLLHDNTSNQKPYTFSLQDGKLAAAPDYVFGSEDGQRFVVIEKFSSIYSSDFNHTSTFDSDGVKVFGLLEGEQPSENQISHGYHLTWYYEYVDTNLDGSYPNKMIQITSFRLIKMRRDENNNRKFKRYLEEFERFNSEKKLKVDGMSISNANKCLNCSVMTFCKHKSGAFNTLELPYQT
jgi:hypothetical protein